MRQATYSTNSFFRFLIVTVFSLCLTACDDSSASKNDDTNKNVIGPDVVETPDVPKFIPYSLMSRVKATSDLSTLYELLEDTPLAKRFATKKEAYTLFAPNNEAMDLWLQNADDVEIETLVKNHLVPGKITTVSLTKKIRSNGGSYSMQTVGGKILNVYKKGNKIYLKNITGDKAIVGKSDITGTNGLIHVIDMVLYP